MILLKAAISVRGFFVDVFFWNTLMEWISLPTKQCYELKDRTLSLAFIYWKHKEGVKAPFRTKAVLSSLYLGQKKQKALLKRKKEWSSSQRSFKTKEEMDLYIERKKQALLHYIQTQEALR